MTLQLIIQGSMKALHVECEGQVDLPKQPPFDVATPGHAVEVIVELGIGSPGMARLFDAWYMQEWRAMVTAHDGGPCVRFMARCVKMDWERGMQFVRAWDPPQRRANGQLYRPTPRHQLIKGVTNRYTLAGERWEQIMVPECFKTRTLVVEAIN